MVLALVPIAIALVAVLVLLAKTPLLRVIVELPLVGGWIVANSTRAIDRAYANLAGWSVQAIKPLAPALYWPVFRIEALMGWTINATASSYFAIRRVITVTIPRWSNYNLAVTRQLHDQETRYAQELHTAALARAQVLYELAVAFAQGLYAIAIAYVQ